jgi:phenylacetate-CoA ligase
MSSTYEALYRRSPIWLQQVAVALWGVRWYRRRFGGEFRRYVREFGQRDSWNGSQFRAYQAEQLRRVFRAACDAPYYREVFAGSRVTADTDPWEVLARAPLLAKETLRERGGDLLTRRVPRGSFVSRSSGSTGTPTAVYYTRPFFRQWMAANEVRSYHVAGVTHRDRRFMCGGRKVCAFDQDRPPFWRFSPAEKLAYASAYHLSPRFLPAYLDFLRRYRPSVVMGYPSALAAIATYALEHDNLPPPAKCVITTAETLAAPVRAALESVWKCPVFDQYGASEACFLVTQCEHGRYHVSPDVGIIEILDRSGRPCPPGVVGELVSTGLANDLQPLIRYRVGDSASWSARQDCPCGREMPILEAIEGRTDDLLRTPDGRMIGRIDHIFKNVTNVCEAQVVQERMCRFVIRVVPAPHFTPAEAEALKSNLRLHVGDAEIVVEQVAQIPRTASGKFRAVLCLVPAEGERT